VLLNLKKQLTAVIESCSNTSDHWISILQQINWHNFKHKAASSFIRLLVSVERYPDEKIKTL
jgi:hypothetical protein